MKNYNKPGHMICSTVGTSFGGVLIMLESDSGRDSQKRVKDD